VMADNMKEETTGYGMVYFVGAGPGDPELITLKARNLIERADVIIYAGSLVNPAVLGHARPDVETHDSVGMKLEEQVEVMRRAAEQGKTVVRLHTGDPSVYGATLEQMRGLREHGISYAVVPGVTSAFAAAAALGIEFTVPGDTQTLILSRLSGRTPVPESESLGKLAAHRSSMALFLSAGMTGRVVEELYAAGYEPGTPVAVVFRASWPDELILRGTLADISDRVREAEITHHAVIIISPALKDEPAEDSHLYGTAFDRAERKSTTAIITLTLGGTRTGEKLHALMPGSVLYAPARFVEGAADDLVSYETSVRQTLQSAFAGHDSMVCIMASGIVMRDLAPLLKSKHTDPAVVVLDERGQYAVSLLSGHKGGANELARRVADMMGGTPVLTTASDVLELPAFDLLGPEYGWQLDRGEHLTALSAALVNGEPVGVVQECGDESWWPDPAPPNLTRYPSVDALMDAAPSAALVITFRAARQDVSDTVMHTVVYHPPCLVVGVGCNRGTFADEIVASVTETLQDAGLDARSVREVATVEDKANEAGLLAACEMLGWSLRVFRREEIMEMSEVPPNPSEWAMKVLGVPGVAEPTAMLGAESDSLLVEKRKFQNVTVAVALKRGGEV